MRVGIVFAGVVVLVLRQRLVRRQLLQPLLVILVQAPLVVVDEHRRGDVHRVHQHQAFLDAALGQAVLDLRRDVHETPAAGISNQSSFR